MIKNVIFDFGQVLVRFDPEYMCSVYADPCDVPLLSEVIFDRLYWDRLDAGTISDEELIASVKERLPQRLHKIAEDIYFNWLYNLPEIEGMRDVLDFCRTKGYGLYILSNISKYFAKRYREIPIFAYFDGFVFSAECGAVKPSREIFSHISEKFGLIPCDTLFVDDNAANIRGAKEFGINAYLFNGDAVALLSYLKESMNTDF